MRVTDNMRVRDQIRNLGGLQGRHAEASRQASTGLRLNKPSTDPLGAAQVTRIRDALRKTEVYRENIALARGDVETSENAMATAIELFRRTREIAMQGANDSLSAANRSQLAEEVLSIRSELLSIANTEGANGTLFGGHQVDSPAFSSLGDYLGDEGIRSIEIGAGLTVRTNLGGLEAFEGSIGGTNAFSQLDALVDALNNNLSGEISATLGGIDTVGEQLTKARSDAGLILNRLDAASLTLEQGAITLTKRQSDVADADMVSSVSELNALGTSLEQAVAVARKTLDLNLTRF